MHLQLRKNALQDLHRVLIARDAIAEPTPSPDVLFFTLPKSKFTSFAFFDAANTPMSSPLL